MKCAVVFLLALSVARLASAQTPYDLLLKGGHVIDGRNGIDAVRDVAIKDGKIAAVAANIPSTQATKTVDAAGLYVTPGLVDIHVHGYHGEKGTAYAGGPLGVPIDAFSLRSCVTTVADAGSPGWRNFDDFKARIIDKSKTRVTAFLNIVGHGMGGGAVEQNLADMEVKPTADMALKHKGVIVGIKSAHFNGPEWAPYERAVEVGTIANIPVMVDFGSARVRTIKELFERVFRPGDIYTHAYAGGGRGELIDGKVNPAIFAAQKKGIIFDLGHGGGSFVWQTAVQAFKEGYYPELHFKRPARDQHERRHEGHDEHHEQVSGARDAAQGCRRAVDMEPGEGNQARTAGEPVGRGACRRRGAAAREGQVRLPRSARRAPRRQAETRL